ncbi:MAG: phosphoribosylaminoimidazolesuccinocarboxamide synthase [bacterium]
MELLYEGKAKKVFETESPNEVIILFKDDATAFNGIKKDNIKGKGRVNLAFTRYFFELLQSQGVETHIVSFLDEISLKAKKVKIFPIELVVRNLAAGSICKRLGFKKGFKFTPPLCETFLKDDALGDPILCETHIMHLNLLSEEELNLIKQTALKINSIMFSHLDSKGITLVDFKLEFGKSSDGKILLADEISPDTCRFWIKGSMESLDKDVYREDKGDLVASYCKLAEILGVKL